MPDATTWVKRERPGHPTGDSDGGLRGPSLAVSFGERPGTRWRLPGPQADITHTFALNRVPGSCTREPAGDRLDQCQHAIAFLGRSLVHALAVKLEAGRHGIGRRGGSRIVVVPGE